MSRNTYDNWVRLVDAVLRKEHDRELAYAPSLESSFNSVSSANFSARFSLESPIHDVTFDGSGISNPIVHSVIPSSWRSKSSSYRTQEISFKELKKATRSFHPGLIVGKGGTGDVYKGWINESNSNPAKPGLFRFFKGSINESIITAAKTGSGAVVAVKRLRPCSYYGRTEWLAEINYLSQIRHPNIVKLIGYCAKEKDHLLVYEFAKNGSLYNHLFGCGHPPLSWATRIKVAMHVARALSFLHDHMEKKIIHRYCKPRNILLDEDFNAILSDFGWAMTLPTPEMTHISPEVVVGTIGYLDPEYFENGDVTAKSDVYGFGAILLELITGRSILDRPMDDEKSSLKEWATSYLSDEREFIRIVDTKLEGQCPPGEVFTVAMIALHCLSNKSEKRPTMSDVVLAIEQL